MTNKRGRPPKQEAGMSYCVTVRSSKDVGGLKRGFNAVYVVAESGDEAAMKVREANRSNDGLTINGITPGSAD